MGYSLNRIVTGKIFSFVGIWCVFSLDGGSTHLFIYYHKNLYNKNKKFENVKFENEVTEN